MSKPLLIAYLPGARGDFLAAVLLDQPDEVFNRSQVFIKDLNHQQITPGIFKFDCHNNSYYKLHIAHYLTSELLLNCYSIKINTIQENDYPVIRKLYNNKRSANAPALEYCVIDSKNVEDQYAGCTFDLDVNFKDLFNIESINRIYRKVNGRDLSAPRIAVIQHNIELQLALLDQSERQYLRG